ncbi:beta-ketoacyl synthase chain length factor [Vibrio hannami]|uniref:beta-ketoacyl synthase chain length factor n=1 Tax=Vibrio hannami TaxID=2717094 RepID=UPI002410420B|nr:beta-ketoacyl synthase chain length factor [Vibrio hannami]MDG3087527.1 beta-ketoacyl synthase chain length factor [Vibrio hannami]
MSKKNLNFKFNFAIEQWFALSEGLTKKDAWCRWADSNEINSESTIPVNLIPPMMRRRMSSLSKLATQVAIHLLSDYDVDYLIFSSRHGELPRTVELLKAILSGDEASPMAFSQSVHNTAAGLTTIATKQAIPVTSIAAGEDTFHQALIEAYAYISEYPDKRVLVIDFDEPLPEIYNEYETKQFSGYALGFLLSAAGSDSDTSKSFGLTANRAATEMPETLPQSVSVLKRILQGKKEWQIESGSYQWEWKGLV